MSSKKDKCDYPESKVWYEDLQRFGCRGKRRHPVPPDATDSSPQQVTKAESPKKVKYVKKPHATQNKEPISITNYTEMFEWERKKTEIEQARRFQQMINDKNEIINHNENLHHELSCLVGNLTYKYKNKNISMIKTK